MASWRLNEAQRSTWLEELVRSGRRVVAPVIEAGLTVFRTVSSAGDVVLDDYGNSRWSPKEFLFPSTEALFSYELSGDEVHVEAAAPAEEEQVLFGLRPCDAAGLRRLDDVFLGEGPPDRLFAARREATTTVSLACAEARPECFCTAVGGSPAGTDGADVLVVPLDGDWLVEALTEKGEALVSAASPGWTPASEEDRSMAEEQAHAVETAIAREPLAGDQAAALELAFDNPLWETLGERCLGCGICAFVCPSCSCFDVADEGSAFCGSRCRLWDTCTLARFTKHAGGHDPRSKQPARYRQRVLHKFAYFPLEHEGRFMCVGCGRCLKLCPVGLDIHRSVELAVSAAPAEDAQ